MRGTTEGASWQKTNYPGYAEVQRGRPRYAGGGEAIKELPGQVFHMWSFRSQDESPDFVRPGDAVVGHKRMKCRNDGGGETVNQGQTTYITMSQRNL